jgi:MGT family glycosyltransferase
MSYSFLFVNLPFSGHINPTLELAEMLVEKGHQVTYIVDEDFKEMVEETGASFVPYDNYDSNWSEMRKYTASFDRAFQTAKRMGKDFDCIISEAFFVFGKHVADELNKPNIRLFSMFALNHEVLNAIKRTGGFHFKLINDWNPLYRMVAGYYSGKNRMETNGFFSEISENVPDINIVYTSRTFQLFDNQFDDRFTFVGPAINNLSQPDIEEEIPYDEMHETIIYIAMGTMLPRFAKRIYKRTIEAFKEEKVSLIMTIGDSLKKSDLGEIPENVYVYPKVPQVDVLEHSSVFITHGGMNSVNEGIHSKVPMVVGPIVNDQPIIADQIETLNIGKRMNLMKAKPEKIKQVTFSVLEDRSIKEAIEQVGQEMKDLGGNKAAVNAILTYMDNLNQ